MTDGGELTARASFTPDPDAPARARAFLRDALRSWDLPSGQVDDAVLLVSELVANGVQHAGTALEVRCRLGPSGLEVLVTDHHPARSLPDAPPPIGDTGSERGRGLLLPTVLAAAWGVTYTAAAKTVWFILPPPGAGGADGDAGAHGGLLPDGDPADDRMGALGNLGFDELVRRTVEFARDAVGADAAYALVADEEGELRVRGAVGIAVPEALTVPPGKVVLSGRLPDGPARGRLGGWSRGRSGHGQVARSQLAVPFLVDGRVTGVLGVGAAADGAFSAADSARLQRVADKVAMSLERLRLSELERIRRGRVAFLAEAAELLSTALDSRQVIALTAQLMVPRLAAWCAVFLVGPGSAGGSGSGVRGYWGAGFGAAGLGTGGTAGEPSGELRPAYVWHEDESRIDELSDLLDEIAPPSLARVMAGPVSSWSLAVPPGAGGRMARMASDAAWCFPLAARGRGLGAVVIGRPRGDRRWPDPVPRESLELAGDLTRRAALALDNARLYERQRTTTQALRNSLLPTDLPAVDGVELAAEYEAAGAASDVGGDFYDVFPVPGDGPEAGPAGGRRWRFAIGDVCGTGPEAAAVAGLARSALRILAAEGYEVTEVVERLNRLIVREAARDRFVTLLHGEIRVTGSGPVQMSLVCAGHPPPLLLRARAAGGAGSGSAVGAAGAAGSGEVGGGPRPAARSQALLGVLDGLGYVADEVLLHPGDVLLCVTDGVTERRDDLGRLLDDDDGLARLLATGRDLSAWAVVSRIRRAVSDFGSEPLCDDLAILVLRAE